MKLKVIAKYKDGTPSNLKLEKERKTIKHGDTFEVDEERGQEILNAKFYGYPVAEVVKENKRKKVNDERGSVKKH